MTKKNTLKKTIFSKFSEKGFQKKEKYLGDVYLQYQDIYDSFSPEIRYMMFGAVTSKNYIHLALNDYSDFGKLMGQIILQFKAQEALHKYQQTPEYQAAIQEQMANQNNTQIKDDKHGIF
jgi:pyruvate-formate lyase